MTSHFSGHSRDRRLSRSDPWPSSAHDQDGLLVGTVDFAGTQEVRAGYGSQLRDRRPELYAAVSAPAKASVGAPASSERK